MESEYLKQRRLQKIGLAPAEPEKERKAIPKEAEKNKAPKREKKKDLSIFYATQGANAPKDCENCGHPLRGTINFHPRAHICHIVPKGKHGCPSVATNKDNRWYGCLVCHDFYDQKPSVEVAEMSIIPVLRERLKLFIGKIKQDELRRVPEFLLSNS